MEWHLVERPTIDALAKLAYEFIPPTNHASLRQGDNQVLFRPHLIEALQRINGISESDAQAAYTDLVSVADNQTWLSILRGNFSRIIQGETTRRTLRVVDFHDPSKNRFTVTNEF